MLLSLITLIANLIKVNNLISVDRETIHVRGKKKVIVSMSLDPELLRKIDEQRGLIPRSAFIEHELTATKFAETKKNILALCNDLESLLDLKRIPPRIASAASVQITINEGRKKVSKIKSLIEKAI